jgi:FkbM family methyltransferase
MAGPGVFGTYIETFYEPPIAQAMNRLIRPGWTVADVGAHLGYFTLLLADLVRETGCVFAFEAQPENAAWLRANVALNGLSNRVAVENVAVTDGSQPLVRLNAPQHYTNQYSIIKASPVGRSLEVQAIALDRYFSRKWHLDFVKMDIEGAEYQAFQGMRHLLQRDKPSCLVELHGEEGQKAARYLQETGYHLRHLDGTPISGPALPSHILALPNQS